MPSVVLKVRVKGPSREVLVAPGGRHCRTQVAAVSRRCSSVHRQKGLRFWLRAFRCLWARRQALPRAGDGGEHDAALRHDRLARERRAALWRAALEEPAVRAQRSMWGVLTRDGGGVFPMRDSRTDT